MYQSANQPHMGYPQQIYYTHYLPFQHVGSKLFFQKNKQTNKSFPPATDFNLIVTRTYKDNIPVLSEVVQVEELKAQSWYLTEIEY